MDIASLTNEQLEQLVTGTRSGGGFGGCFDLQGLSPGDADNEALQQWDDGLALFEGDFGDFAPEDEDPSAFKLPTFPLSAPPQPAFQFQLPHHIQQGISPDLLSFAPPSLVSSTGGSNADGKDGSSSCYSSSFHSAEDDSQSERSAGPRVAFPSAHAGAFGIIPPSQSDDGCSSFGGSEHKVADVVGGGGGGKAAKAQTKGRKGSAASDDSAGAKQPYKRVKTGCLCCRQRRVRCCETKPDCKRCRNAGRECIWPSAENPTSTRKVPGGEVILASGTLIGAKKAGAAAVGMKNGGGGGSKRSERGAGKNHKTEAKKASAPAPAIVDDVSMSSLSPPPVQSIQFHSTSSTTGSSALSSGPSEASPVLDPEAILAAQQPPQMHQQGQRAAPMQVELGTDHWLLPWFPTAEQRGLILHFCQSSGALLMAKPPSVSPILATLLPLSLSAPRGTSPPVDGLRTTLLCIAATHQAYLLARAHAPQEIVGRALELAVQLRAEGRARARVAEEACVAQGELVLERLAGAVMGSVVDVMLGGHGYSKNLEMALEIVRSCGGPDVLLQSSTSVDLGLGQQMSPLRQLLEILAVHEVFAGFVSGQDVKLINEGAWWSAVGQTSYHRESVENHFGVTRAVISLLAKANSLVIRASQASGDVAEYPAADDCLFDATDDAVSLAFLRDVTGLGACPSLGPQPNEPDVNRLRKDAGTLASELERELALVSVLPPGRLRDGCVAHLQTAKILILRQVFKVDRTDDRVQDATLAVLEACSSAVNTIRPTHLTWPMLVAATQVNVAARPWIVTLFDGLRTQCCFSVDSAEKIVREVWARLDRGEEWADWKTVVVDLDMKVLLT